MSDEFELIGKLMGQVRQGLTDYLQATLQEAVRQQLITDDQAQAISEMAEKADY